MTHSERIFSKAIDQLTYSDIETYFSEPRGETDLIEFKGYDSTQSIKLNFPKVQTAFCAMLNSQGGLIVWGAPYGIKVTGQKEKVFQGELKPIDSVPGKDSMVSSLADKITPLPNNFNLVVLPNPENTKSIIIIQLQKSEYVHQFDERYWMRLDGQNRSAPHHYVEALMKQIKFPIVEAYIKFNNTTVVQNAIALHLDVYVFNFSPMQNEENVAITITCGQGTFEECKLNVANPKCRMFGSQIVESPIGILSYGAPMKFNYTIFLTTAKLSQSSGQVDLILQFVGKQSPSKMSKYKLKFRSPGTLNTIELNRCLTSAIENKLMVDLQEQIGKSKMEQLETLLDRKPQL